MLPLSSSGRRIRRRDDDHGCRRHDENELPAIAPGEIHGMFVCLADPPAVAVRVPAPAGGGARRPGAVYPGLRQHLFSVGRATTIEVQTSEREHLAGSHPHLVATEENALRVGRPGAQADTEWRE